MGDNPNHVPPESGMATSLSEKNAIVTGGSRGIGAQIAYELARRGANVRIENMNSNYLFN